MFYHSKKCLFVSQKMPVNYSGSPEPASPRESALQTEAPLCLPFGHAQPLAGASGTIGVNITEEERYFYVLTKCKASPNSKSCGTAKVSPFVPLPAGAWEALTPIHSITHTEHLWSHALGWALEREQTAKTLVLRRTKCGEWERYVSRDSRQRKLRELNGKPESHSSPLRSSHS